MDKKKYLIEKITKFDGKYFNEDQKKIAISILENSPEEEVQAYADFIFMKRRTGFAFDYSPEIAKGRLITLKEDIDRRINVGSDVSEDENKLIIGDNYNALKSLLVTHKEKIDIIYIDPPYNTESMAKDGNSSNKDGKANALLYKNKYGRKGWLTLMKERLQIAKELLTDDGVIFIAIDDAEQAYLKVLCDDIFMEENFISSFPIRSQPNGRILNGISRKHEYIVTYAKNKKSSFMLTEFNENNDTVSFLRGGDNSNAQERPRRFYPIIVDKTTKELISITDKEYEKIYDGKTFNEDWISQIDKKYNSNIVIWPLNKKGERKVWQRKFDRFKDEKNEEIIYDLKTKTIRTIKSNTTHLSSWLDSKEYSYSHHGAVIMKSILPETNFRYPKSIPSIQLLILSVKNNKNATILDFFAGSGSTGHAVMDLNKNDDGNRKFILCTNNENEIANKVTFERLHRVITGKAFACSIDFDWIKNNKPYSNEKLRVININDDIKISLDQDIDPTIYKEAKDGLKLLDLKYNKENLNLYYDLAALNPLENDEDQFNE